MVHDGHESSVLLPGAGTGSGEVAVVVEGDVVEGFDDEFGDADDEEGGAVGEEAPGTAAAGVSVQEVVTAVQHVWEGHFGGGVLGTVKCLDALLSIRVQHFQFF